MITGTPKHLALLSMVLMPSTGAFAAATTLIDFTVYRMPLHSVALEGIVALDESKTGSEALPHLSVVAQKEQDDALAVTTDNSTQTTGEKKILVIRVDFSDLPGDPGHGLYTAPYVQQIADTRVGPFFQRSSYGLATLKFTVTPQLYRMPWAAANYAVSTSLDGLYDNALAAAESDYVLNNYDKIAVLFPSLAGLPGSGFVARGWAEIGGSRVWLNGVFVLTSVAHELGHTLGLEHANLWHVTDGNPVSDHGSSIEYGDPFDPMGSANLESDQSADFNPWFKSLLHWIPDSPNNNSQWRLPGLSL